MNLKEIKSKSPSELLALAEEYGVENANNLRKQDIIYALLKKMSEQSITVIVEGVIEILPDGFGFLRSAESNYLPGPDDIYISASFIKRFWLKTGDVIEANVKQPREGEKFFTISRINSVNGDTPENSRKRTTFDNLTPLYPNEMLRLEVENYGDNKIANTTQRIIDIVSPIGKGQRALIVAPPRTGKTVMLKTIAQSVATKYPDIHIIVLLIDERPEEVTDMQRSIQGEVISSTFDEPVSRHVQVSEMVIEKAKRLVEQKKDVLILLDSITRLARAYNTVAPASGKVLTGGIDAHALQRPKRFFGAARNIEEGGSLTIIATALVETGSRMDDVIFEEFKGTGNSEIVLDRKISDKRIFPAIDVNKSGTRKEELLIKDNTMLQKIWILRRILGPMSSIEAMEFLTDKCKMTKNNVEFFDVMGR